MRERSENKTAERQRASEKGRAMRQFAESETLRQRREGVGKRGVGGGWHAGW